MPKYTIPQLERVGAPIALSMLIDCINNGRDFVRYGSIAEALEHQMKVDNVFPTQIGRVAGYLMDQILLHYPKAPLINAMITRSDGVPSKGIGSYFYARYKKQKFQLWDTLPRAEKIELMTTVRRDIFSWKEKWPEVFSTVFGGDYRALVDDKTPNEPDAMTTQGRKYGPGGESEEHKNLKKWVEEDATRIGLAAQFGRGKAETPLESGDLVDVVFSHGIKFAMVEVKSCRSNDKDLERGIYQCVKYRAVKIAEQAPYKAEVTAILVTERALSSVLQAKAKMLGVKHVQVAVNKWPKK